jgi:hypothetical protein
VKLHDDLDGNGISVHGFLRFIVKYGPAKFYDLANDLAEIGDTKDRGWISQGPQGRIFKERQLTGDGVNAGDAIGVLDVGFLDVASVFLVILQKDECVHTR